MKNKVLLIILVFFISCTNIYAKKILVEYSDCVDGDTIKVILDNKKQTVRLLAVDTPESVHPTKKPELFGKEASEFTCDKIKNAKKIEIEYDNNSDKTDKYKRVLAWVYVDGILLQKQLIQKGYAKVAYLYGDYKYTEELKVLQKDAKNNKVGIWSTKEEIKKSEKEESKTLLEEIIDLFIGFIKEIFNIIFKQIKKVINSF